MAHKLSTVETGSGYAIVCIGDAWHGLQNAFTGDAQKDLAQAGLNFDVIKLPAFAQLPSGEFARIDGRWSNARSDTFLSLGISADGYKVHQPSDIYGFVTKYFAAQENWELSSMFSIHGGKEICVTARYPDHLVGGMNHHRYALMSTSFDTTQATRLQPTDVNAICKNTLRAAWAEGDKQSCVVKINHNAKFDAKTIADQLAQVLAGSDRYKVIGDALATVAVTEEFNKTFFKTLVGIDPAGTDKEKISTRTLNNYNALWSAFYKSREERNGSADAFTALNAVTRYVDHVKTVQNGERMASAMFGAGDRFKGQALSLLMPLIADKVAA